MNAFGPPSDHDFFSAFSNESAMPMNMIAMSTPLEPPMVFDRMLARQLQVNFASASGNLSLAASSAVPAFAIVDPQSASPTLESSSSKNTLESIKTWQAF